MYNVPQLTAAQVDAGATPEDENLASGCGYRNLTMWVQANQGGRPLLEAWIRERPWTSRHATLRRPKPAAATPVDPAGPDRYRGGAKPCKSSAPGYGGARRTAQ